MNNDLQMICIRIHFELQVAAQIRIDWNCSATIQIHVTRIVHVENSRAKEQNATTDYEQ